LKIMGYLVELPPSILKNVMFNGTRSQREGETPKRETPIPTRVDSRANSRTLTRVNRSERKRSIRSTSTVKRIRGIRESSGILSSQFILSICWFALAILLACDKQNNLFFLPIVEGRPERYDMCTRIMTVIELEYSATVGLQDFGKQLSDVPANPLSYLTVLPGSFKDLCQRPLKGDHDLLNLKYPSLSIAIMVDLESGGCDVLTKATNALELQQFMASDLNYILFYKSKYTNVSALPKLDLDHTMPPTNQPTNQPTTPKPTNQPTTPKPTSSPTSFSSTPSESPSTTASPSISPEPSATPSVSTEPTVSMSPSQGVTETESTLVPTIESSKTHTILPSDTSTTIVPTTENSAPSSFPTYENFEKTSTPTIFPTTAAPSAVPVEGVDSLNLQKASWQSYDVLFYDDDSHIYIDGESREWQKKRLEDNDSLVFLSLSLGDAHNILSGIYRPENFEGGKTPEFSMPGNENWDIQMLMGMAENSPTCSSDPVPGNPPTPAYVLTPRPTRPPIPGIRFTPAPTQNNQPSASYQDNAPGTFTIFKFIFFALLIASPCLRLLHQWWAGGGRIRLRRIADGDSNRVVGLQYIPPMDNWFGSPLESNEAPRRPDRLTYQQIMSLPEIRYTKPIHQEDKLSTIQTTETEEDIPESNSSNNSNEYEADDTDTIQSSERGTETIGTPTLNQETAVIEEPELDEDESVVLSEASFENEPSVRLELPTSPPRVSSTSIHQESNPLSPRAIVLTEEVPPDEESPEEQEQPQEQVILQQPSLSPTPPTPMVVHEQQLEHEDPQNVPQSPSAGGPAPPLSFRTQRRLKSFTTTTCTTCSICIDEFEEGETIRLLPRCGHAFHTSCILPWLQDRQGCCPLCKTEVLERSAEEEANETSNRAEF